jgi:zinc-ribbon domain
LIENATVLTKKGGSVGVMAGNRGRSGAGWFLLAVVISPLLAFIFCIASRDLSAGRGAVAEVPSDSTHIRCPKCAELVLPQAVVCKHCGADLVPDPMYFYKRAMVAQESRKYSTRQALSVVAVVVLLLAVAWALAKAMRG